MVKKVKELRRRLQEINDLQLAARVLSWDLQTYMPPGGAKARGQQLSTLNRLAHEKQVDPALGLLLDDLLDHAGRLDYESDEASLIRIARRDYERAINIPPKFVAESEALFNESYQAWAAARPENNFSAVQPYLERNLELSRRYADFFPGYDHIADPLINRSDYGMKAHFIKDLFANLREQQLSLIKHISRQPEIDDACLYLDYPEDKQLAFGQELIKSYGYDFERGRQDKTRHPFMTMFSVNDVRITTRVYERDLGQALFSTLHEAGHALYQLGANQAFEGTPLVWGTSSGVHESQSRLWENLVGRSLPFWEYYYPRLQEMFPSQLSGVALKEFYRAINKVKPSLIRTDADEVTYNLHVMIRFELELDLLEGHLAVKDLPDAWHARYEKDLGIHAPDDRDGVLQDVHWFGHGYIGGAFQGYTLGNILSSLFFEQATKEHPGINEEMRSGRFDSLHNWLKENIYQHGRKFTANELVQRVSGEQMTIEPYMRYLWSKYATIYDL